MPMTSLGGHSSGLLLTSLPPLLFLPKGVSEKREKERNKEKKKKETRSTGHGKGDDEEPDRGGGGREG